MTLQAENLTYGYGFPNVLHQINLILEPGVSALVGPNAAGKSTLLKCLSGILSPVGRVFLNGRDLSTFSRRECSQSISYLPQSDFQRGSLTVFEIVLLGRLHDLSWRVSPSDVDSVQKLLEEMSLDTLASNTIQELSGGQAQLVALAQALIREPTALLLDEPTSNLDLRHQFEVCTQIREMSRSRKMITLISIHDLNVAAHYADRVIVLNQGTIYAVGSPAQVLTRRMMSDVYRVDAEVTQNAIGLPQISVCGPLRNDAESAVQIPSGRDRKHS